MAGSSATARVFRDIGVAILGFVIVFAVAYASGRAFMPGFREALGDIEFPQESPAEVSIPALRADLAALEPPAALVELSGTIEGRLALDRAQSTAGFQLAEPELGIDVPVDLNIRFTNNSAGLTIVSEQVPTNEPRSEDMTVVLTAEGQTFTARPGNCSLELIESGYTIVTRPWGQFNAPSYSGHLVCVDLLELRSGEPVSFTAVFVVRDDH